MLKLKTVGRILRILLLGMLVAFFVAADSFFVIEEGEKEHGDVQKITAADSFGVDASGFTVLTKVETAKGYSCTTVMPQTEVQEIDNIAKNTAKAHRDSFFNSKGGTIRIVGSASKLAQMVSLHISVRWGAGAVDYTWVYDTDEETFRTLPDFFDGTSFPSAEFAQICLDELSVYTGGEIAEELRTATSPTEQNYRLFTVSKNGISLYFPANKIGLTGATRRVLIDHDLIKDSVSYHIPSTGAPLLWKINLPAGLPPQDRPYKIALTFDDGPSNLYTPKLLEGLAERQAKATFFMLGLNAEKYPDIVAQVANGGHLIGNHSYGHPMLTKLSAEGVRNEIAAAREAIEAACGISPRLVRPPYGSMSGAVLQNIGGPAILWSVDVADWNYRNAQYICDTTLAVVKDGDIVLMHDIHETSVEAALMIIGELSDKGYAFVTVEELLTSRGIEMENGKKYYYARQ